MKKALPNDNATPDPDRSSRPAFRRRLLAWYDANARDLPWRTTRDPYRIWLSEIMLQQTRVAAVIEHYYEFLRRFPTVGKLAAAREQSVLAAWSGLGYYRRARMLHAAAKKITREYAGEFPSTSQQLRALPGIGRYTANAVASIAFGKAVAVVDGNVERVLHRVSGEPLAGEQLWNAADHLLDAHRPGDFNQAMMELGATICTPRSPHCLVCPIRNCCVTRGEAKQLLKPPRQRKREIHYSLASRNAHTRDLEVFLVQRPRDASLMAGMWELPEAITALRADKNDLLLTIRHSITVTDFTVKVWSADDTNGSPGRWIPSSRLSRLALTGLAKKILHRSGLMKASREKAAPPPRRSNQPASII